MNFQASTSLNTACKQALSYSLCQSPFAVGDQRALANGHAKGQRSLHCRHVLHHTHLCSRREGSWIIVPDALARCAPGLRCPPRGPGTQGPHHSCSQQGIVSTRSSAKDCQGRKRERVENVPWARLQVSKQRCQHCASEVRTLRNRTVAAKSRALR